MTGNKHISYFQKVFLSTVQH